MFSLYLGCVQSVGGPRALTPTRPLSSTLPRGSSATEQVASTTAVIHYIATHNTLAATYTESDHFYTPNNMNYYQPNQYHYHSTPWQYRWGRSVRDDEDDLSSNVTRSRRAAEPRLGAASSLRSLPVNSISSMAENVSLAYQPDVWTNDMIFKVRQTTIHTAM